MIDNKPISRVSFHSWYLTHWVINNLYTHRIDSGVVSEGAGLLSFRSVIYGYHRFMRTKLHNSSFVRAREGVEWVIFQRTNSVPKKVITYFNNTRSKYISTLIRLENFSNDNLSIPFVIILHAANLIRFTTFPFYSVTFVLHYQR